MNYGLIFESFMGSHLATIDFFLYSCAFLQLQFGLSRNFRIRVAESFYTTLACGCFLPRPVSIVQVGNCRTVTIKLIFR